MLYRRFCQYVLQNDLLKAGENLLLGISGGPDSVALGHLFKRRQEETGGVFLVGHVNHLLRPEAREEAELTARLCQQWNWPCYIAEIDVLPLAEKNKESLQAEAREQRLKFFQKIMAANKTNKLALAHQADDQAETVLFWFLRSASLKSLGGIRPKAEMEWGTIIHPLLSFSRREILAYLEQHKLPYLIDKSNLETKYLRNKLRGELLPLLEQQYNPNLKRHLINLAEQLQAADDYLEANTEEVYQKFSMSLTETGISLFSCELLNLPPVLRPRIWQKLIKKAGGSLKNVSADHYQFLDNLLKKEKSFVTLPGGLTVRKEAELLFIELG